MPGATHLRCHFDNNLSKIPAPSLQSNSHSPRAVTETHLAILKAATVLILSATAGISQTPAPAATPVQPTQPALPKPLPGFYRNLIVVDPAHGGPDAGARLADNAVEKSVTLTFAQRLRPALQGQGFTVTSTRDSDPSDLLSTDQRAGVANHDRPLVCLVLHATSTGSGVHIVSSALEPAAESSRALRWNEAQSATIPLSLKLANEVGLALTNAHLSVNLLRASVPPIDNLICPAVLIEIAPLAPQGGSRTPVTDAAYQQRVAEAIALGLASFRTHNAPAPSSVPPAAPPPLPRAVPPAPAAKPATNPAAAKPSVQPAKPAASGASR